MMNVSKYKKQYYLPPETCMDWAKKDYIDKAPAWCSVDLRDGNQALVIPMSLEQKVEFFKLLVQIGFKEIEVGFPAASETEYTFLRTLIDRKLIPEDVTIQVLTQAREHIIRKTFEAVKGAPKAIVHVYNSTSVAQREQVFKKSKEEILKIAVEGAKLLKELAEQTEGNFQFEYSPESFTGTEPEYALEVCNAVIDVWQPTPDNKCIINLPVTVEHSMPHVYASQVEYMCKHMLRRENVIVSLHPHNDRGCGVADSEMGILAGADRIEGTLFGNGERTGNVDIVTLGMNMYSQGVDPKLDFSDMPHICEVYERCTGMTVGERSPYSGALVFAAFSGSHQDAIAKGMHWIEEKDPNRWTVPYLPIDPTDVGRNYDAYEQVKKYADKVDLIVCSGGDGTLDEVVTGITEVGSKVPVGYIPAGSTNDFANSLFMPKNMLDAASMIMKEEIYRCDVGRFNSQTFAYVAAFGLFTDVSYETSQDLKNILGHLAYVLEGAKRLLDIKAYHMKVTTENGVIEDNFIYGMVTNSRSVGGFKNLTKDVDMNDGLFEVTLIVQPKNPLEMQEIIRNLLNMEDNSDLIYSFKARKLTVEAEEEVAWTLDGEYGGSPRLVEIENLQQALNLCLKSDK